MGWISVFLYLFPYFVFGDEVWRFSLAFSHLVRDDLFEFLPLLRLFNMHATSNMTVLNGRNSLFVLLFLKSELRQ
jgi:hypothetical protein